MQRGDTSRCLEGLFEDEGRWCVLIRALRNGNTVGVSADAGTEDLIFHIVLFKSGYTVFDTKIKL